MKPVLAILMGLLMITSACRKEQRGTNNRTPKVQVRLTKIVETDSSGYGWQQVFNYNSKGYLQAFNSYYKPQNSAEWLTNVTITFEYDANNRVAYENWSSPMGGSYKGHYTYNEQGKLVQVKYIDRNDETNHRVVYSYYNNKPISVTLYSLGDMMMESHSFLYNAQGNVSWHTTNYRTFTNPETRADNTVYDDMPNYVQTVKGLENYLYVFGPEAQTLSNSNLIRSVIKTPGSSETTDYQYTYNQYRQVEKQVRNNGERTRTFTYEEYK